MNQPTVVQNKKPKNRRRNTPSCQRCRKLHIKCDGEFPHTCSRKIVCIYPSPKKRGRKPSKFKSIKTNKPSKQIQKHSQAPLLSPPSPPEYIENFTRTPIFSSFNNSYQSTLQLYEQFYATGQPFYFIDRDHLLELVSIVFSKRKCKDVILKLYYAVTATALQTIFGYNNPNIDNYCKKSMRISEFIQYKNDVVKLSTSFLFIAHYCGLVGDYTMAMSYVLKAEKLYPDFNTNIFNSNFILNKNNSNYGSSMHISNIKIHKLIYFIVDVYFSARFNSVNGVDPFNSSAFGSKFMEFSKELNFYIKNYFESVKNGVCNNYGKVNITLAILVIQYMKIESTIFESKQEERKINDQFPIVSHMINVFKNLSDFPQKQTFLFLLASLRSQQFYIANNVVLAKKWANYSFEITKSRYFYPSNLCGGNLIFLVNFFLKSKEDHDKIPHILSLLMNFWDKQPALYYAYSLIKKIVSKKIPGFFVNTVEKNTGGGKEYIKNVYKGKFVDEDFELLDKNVLVSYRKTFQKALGIDETDWNVSDDVGI